MTDRKQLNNEQAILGRFQELRNEISQISAKANELAAESQEHDLVLKALEPLEGERKCYRVVRQLLRTTPMRWHVACSMLFTQESGLCHEYHIWDLYSVILLVPL